MRKILALYLALILVLGLCSCTTKSATYVAEDGTEVKYSYVTKYTDDKFASFEKALSKKGIVFTSEDKADGIINGALKGKIYKLSDGRVLEMYQMDIASEGYMESAKTSTIKTNFYEYKIDVLVNDEYALLPTGYQDIKEIFENL